MATLRLRLVALLTLLSALLPLGGSAQGRYFCQMMDRVVDGCCCPDADAGAPASAELESRATAPDCCVRLASSAALGAAVPREATRPLATPALWAALPAIEARIKPCDEPPGARFAEARRLPAPERRLFLEHCALLI